MQPFYRFMMAEKATAHFGGTRILRNALSRLFGLLVLLLALATLLFFLLQLTGDPVLVLAGSDASEAQIEAIRREYGFDQPLFAQYVAYMANLLQLDFGTSLASGEPAMMKVLAALPATLLLTALGMMLTLLIAIPVGCAVGIRRGGGRLSNMVLFVAQGVPGFVAALVLVQVFAISLDLLPAIGFGGPSTWILPAVSISAFLVPKLARIVAKNVELTLSAQFVRTARSYGIRGAPLLWRHIFPNAIVGAGAVIGAQFAFLISGVVVIESIFAWPGLGRLLVDATLELDFAVVQAATLTVAVLVFLVNVLTDATLDRVDVRLKEGRS